MCDDPDVTKVIRFLREREVVHFQRFGELQRPTLNEIVRITAVIEAFTVFSKGISVAKNVNTMSTLI